ncbi:hypothetical protein [Thalassobaculum sp.]|uniref:hypothetical protein n=1 Tax=Thalassobaculum sp. TaxID=2022740 RepID=UPI0032ED55C0
MSSVAKGVGKVFKKVGKVAKKVAPYALAAGAVYFTAGAALGVTAAGGWGAVAGSLSSSLGLSPGLTAVVTGAVTQAGYGAAIGAAGAAITGGDIGQGALYGAAAGAVTGGISGAAGIGTDPLGSGTGVTGGNAAPAAPGPTGVANLQPPAGAATAPGSAASYVTGGNAPAAARGGGGLLGPGGWLERNQTLVGETVKGIGGGLLQGLSAQDEAKALENRDRRRAGNYASGGGLLDRAAVVNGARPGAAHPTVEEKYAPSHGYRIEYRYNAETDQVDRVRVA